MSYICLLNKNNIPTLKMLIHCVYIYNMQITTFQNDHDQNESSRLLQL